MIKQFSEENSWLSNFYKLESPIEWQGLFYFTVENFYVAMKTEDFEEREYISDITPGKAKRYGRKLKIRKDWDSIKELVMKQAIEFKFSKDNPILMNKLIATGDVLIEEGNSWNDCFWGVDLYTGLGDNRLGKIIINRREELKLD